MSIRYLVKGTASTSTLTLTDVPSSGRIFNRSEGLTTGKPLLTGAYTGSAPQLQGRVKLVSDSSVVADWADLTSFSASAGNWSGRGPSVSQSSDLIYKFEVRNKNNTGQSAAGSNHWGIGINWLMTGQSNEGTFGNSTDQSVAAGTGVYHINRDNNILTDYTLAGFFGGNGDALGNGQLQVSNAIANTLGVCVCGLCMAYNATSVDGVAGGDWDNFTAGAIGKFFDNDFEFIHWNQGEEEFLYGFGTPYRKYFDWIEIMHNKALALTGRSAIPIYMSSLGWSQNWPGAGVGTANGIAGTNKANQQQIYLDAPSVLSYVKYINSNVPEHTATNDQHKDATGSLWDGQRGAPSVMFYKYGHGAGATPFFVTDISATDSTHTVFTLTHSLGTDFTPTTDIRGFKISGDDGASYVVPSNAVRTDANHITATHSAVGTTNNALLRCARYLFDADDDLSAPVFDNSSPVAFPLNYITKPIRNSVSMPLPILQPWHGAITSYNQGTLTVTQERQTIVAAIGDLIITGYVSGASPTPNAATITLPDSTVITLTKIVGTTSSIWHGVAPKAILISDVCKLTWTYATNPFTNPASMNVWVADHTKLSAPSTPLTTVTGSATASAAYPSIPAPTISTTAGGFMISVINAPTVTNLTDQINGPRCVKMTGSTEAFCDDSSMVEGAVPSLKFFHASNVSTNASSSVTAAYDSGSEPNNGDTTTIAVVAWH